MKGAAGSEAVRSSATARRQPQLRGSGGKQKVLQGDSSDNATQSDISDINFEIDDDEEIVLGWDSWPYLIGRIAEQLYAGEYIIHLQ